MQRSAKTCEHWNMAFHVLTDKQIFVKCQTCPATGQIKPDGGYGFTTAWARMALNGYDTDSRLKIYCQHSSCAKVAVDGTLFCHEHTVD